MKPKIQQKLVFGTLSCVLLLGLAIAVSGAASYLQERSQYVEIGGDRLAYVPHTARFVKVDGEVRRIIRFATTVNAKEANCICPHCCDGVCMSAVLTDRIIGGSTILIAGYIWLECK